MVDEIKDKSLKEILIEMNSKLEANQKKPKKGIWIPFKAKVGRQGAKKGWAIFMVIDDNRNVHFEKHQIKEQTTMVDGIPRTAMPDEVLFYKNKPLVIQPSWSVRPYSPTENYEDTIKMQQSSHGFKLLLNRMQNEAIKPKRTMGGLVVILIIAAVAAAGYFGWKQGWFGVGLPLLGVLH